MIIYGMVLVVLCLHGIKFAKYHSNYMDIRQTQSIKGIFTAIILLSHTKQYIMPQLPLDNLVVSVVGYIGQLMVAVFFFYSGYGIIKAYREKENYINSFFRKRIVKTLVQYDIALLFFLPLPSLIGTVLPWYDYALCWIGWTSLGNTNWFLFVMLCLYALTGIVFLAVTNRFRSKRILVIATAVSAASVALWIFLRLCGKQAWWYNTLLCYPFGMWFAVYKDRFDKVVENGYSRAVLSVFALTGFIYLYFMPGSISYSICACLFCLVIVLLNTWVKIENPVLLWLGKHSFTIYIMQRLPMELLKKAGVAENGVFFLIACVVSTLWLAVLVQRIYGIIDKVGKNNKQSLAQKDMPNSKTR